MQPLSYLCVVIDLPCTVIDSQDPELLRVTPAESRVGNLLCQWNYDDEVSRMEQEMRSRFKDIPALPTSKVYQKSQNACWKTENWENYRFWQVFTRAVLRILFSLQ